MDNKINEPKPIVPHPPAPDRAKQQAESAPEPKAGYRGVSVNAMRSNAISYVDPASLSFEIQLAEDAIGEAQTASTNETDPIRKLQLAGILQTAIARLRSLLEMKAEVERPKPRPQDSFRNTQSK